MFKLIYNYKKDAFFLSDGRKIEAGDTLTYSEDGSQWLTGTVGFLPDIKWYVEPNKLVINDSIFIKDLKKR